VIYAPAENPNPDKLDAMRWLGAEVRQHGRDFDDAREQVERVAKEERLRYVHSANEPLLIAGVGTSRATAAASFGPTARPLPSSRACGCLRPHVP